MPPVRLWYASQVRSTPQIESKMARTTSISTDTQEDAVISALMTRLVRTDTDVVYFPVRHHSPACAALIHNWINQNRPAAVLIEGPADFNPHLEELYLEHQLPIAVYSYFRTAAATRGAYYPFCDYSPEWTALRAGHDVGANVAFIDLPWLQVADEDETTHRYADAKLRRGRYIEMLCQKMHVDDFDDLWDKLVESHLDLDLDEYLRRVHGLCFHIRLWEDDISVTDQQRESYMAQMIRQTQANVDGQVLVVTGGFHSSALVGRLENYECPGIEIEHDAFGIHNTEQANNAETNPVESGISLTTYSYERLDGLTGYNSGMPSPGFYDHVWQHRHDTEFSHHDLLRQLVNELRRRGQTLSTADLIAVETSGFGLAAVRGRSHIWRRDLIDAVVSALIKDELEYGCDSPLIDAVHAVLRGSRRGKLAEGTQLPPLVNDIRRQLQQADLKLQRTAYSVDIDLLNAADLQRSRLLHRLRLLEIVGFERTGGTDFLVREDLTQLWESWRIRWSPEFDATCIEASRYGSSLDDAASNRLLALAHASTGSAASAAELLLQAAQAGINALSATLLERLDLLIRTEGRFTAATEALSHLLYMYCYDEALGTAQLAEVGNVLREAFVRSVWLLELLGDTADNDGQQVRGMRVLLETWMRAGNQLDFELSDFVKALQCTEQDSQKSATIRGAAAGILWTIGHANNEQILADLLQFAQPADLGDFLTGLFALAREVAQRESELVSTIDQLLLEFGADDFQTALPSLRLAFTYFTPREKHYMLTTLFESLGDSESKPLAKLSVDEATAAEALAFEERLYEAIAKYGLEPINE